MAVDATTVMKIEIKHRDKLKKISKETGQHMKFILGKLIDAKYKEVFGHDES